MEGSFSELQDSSGVVELTERPFSDNRHISCCKLRGTVVVFRLQPESFRDAAASVPQTKATAYSEYPEHIPYTQPPRTFHGLVAWASPWKPM